MDLMVIFHCALDLHFMLQHTGTYHAFMYDVLGMRLNCMIISMRKGARQWPRCGREQQRGVQTFDPDEGDESWREHASLLFPMVAFPCHTDRPVAPYGS